MRDCVIYYSLDGNTREAAIAISQALEADMIEIIPAKPLPNNKALAMFIGGYQASFGRGGKINFPCRNLDQYDRIILGTPVWAGKPAAPIQRFLKEYSVKDRIIGVFTCSGGGENEGCMQFLRKQGYAPMASTALADRKNEKSVENNEKIRIFLKSLIIK